MVLADLGRKITVALRSLSNATVINEEVHCLYTSCVYLDSIIVFTEFELILMHHYFHLSCTLSGCSADVEGDLQGSIRS